MIKHESLQKSEKSGELTETHANWSKNESRSRFTLDGLIQFRQYTTNTNLPLPGKIAPSKVTLQIRA